MDDPYITTIIPTRVLIEASKINKDIYHNIKRKLIRSQEKKCNRYGFIQKVYKLIDYQRANITENGSAIFEVKYQVKICSPKREDLIEVTIQKIHIGIISATNGPIKVWINTSNKVNMDIFKYDKNRQLKYKDNVLKKGDRVVVRVLEVEFLPNDKDIRVYGFLEDYKE